MTSKTSTSPPVPRGRTLLLPPGEAMSGDITSSSGSSSPEVFFDAIDYLLEPSPADTPDADDVLEDAQDHHDIFRATQRRAEVRKGSATTQEHANLYEPNENRNQSNQGATNAETKVCCHDSPQGWRHKGKSSMMPRQDYENVFASPAHGTSTDPRHDDENITGVGRDHEKHSSNVTSEGEHRRLGRNNALGNRCEERETQESEERGKSRDLVSRPGCSSQESDLTDTRANSDHCGGSESLDVKTTSEHWEGGESSGGGKLASSQELVPASQSPVSHDGHASREPGGSEIHPLPSSAQSAIAGGATEEQLQNSASVSTSTSFRTRDDTDVEGGAPQASKEEAAPANERKRSPRSSPKARDECEGGKTKANARGRRLLDEIFPVEKQWGSSLREETKKIVMMLSNDRACKVPRPSLGLQDRLQTLRQRSAGRRTPCPKGPCSCSTLVRSIVTNTHHRLQARRDSFQEFIKDRKEQSDRRVFANPVPCYGSAGATVVRIPSVTDVVVGEERSVEAPPLARSPREDVSDHLVHGKRPNSTNENGGTGVSDADTTSGENNRETGTSEVLLGAKIPTGNTYATDTPISSTGSAKTESFGGACHALQEDGEDAGQTAVPLRQNKTECSTGQHPDAQAVPDSVEVSSVHDGPDDVTERASWNDDVAELSGEVPGTPLPSERHGGSKIASTSRPSVGGSVGAISSIPTPDETIETFAGSKTRRPQEEDCNDAVDLEEYIIASLSKVSPKLMAEARGVGEGSREEGGRQEPRVSCPNHQDLEQDVVPPTQNAPGLTQNSSSEASHNSDATKGKLHCESKDEPHETVSLSRVTRLASGGGRSHPEDGAGNIIVQENVQGAGDARTSPAEAEASQAEPHHLWSCFQDITKLKTNNLVARFRGTRPAHAVLCSQYPTPSSAPPQHSKQPMPIRSHPQPNPGSRTMTTTHESKGQTPVDGSNKHTTDGRPLPPNSQQESIDECHFFTASRQGSIDRRSPPDGSDDERPNIVRGSSEGRPSPAPNSRQGSVLDSRRADQRHYARRDSSGGRLSFSAERKRKRANSHHPRSRRCSVDHVSRGSRRDSRSIHQCCYWDEGRGSNSGACLCRRSRRRSFGPDLLRKCLEAAVVEAPRVVDWEEAREGREASARTPSQEDLNASLSRAVCSLDAQEAGLLLRLGADPNVLCGPSPALLRAVQHGALHVVHVLLAAGADVDARTDTGNSPLHVAARGGHGRVAERLVDGGAHVDAINRSGVTPLQVALARGHPEVARTLLRLRADAFLPNKVGETAYEMANHLGYVGLRESGREGVGASPWAGQEEAVPTAVRLIQGIEAGCPATVEGCLAEGASPDTVVPLALHWPAGATVLHRAAHHGHALVARLLLAAGARVDRRDVVGNTPLHAAAQAGHNRAVKLLLREGASPEARSRSGMTPLHRAASKGKEFTCNLLLRRGCDPRAQDDAGLTPADWARKRGFKALAKKLVYRRKSSAALLADVHRKHYLHHLGQLHEAALKAAQQEIEAMDCPE